LAFILKINSICHKQRVLTDINTLAARREKWMASSFHLTSTTDLKKRHQLVPCLPVRHNI